MAVYGDFQGTGGNLTVDSSLLVRDVVNKLIYKEPDLGPLTILLRHPKMRKGTAKSWKHEWAESDNMTQYTQINNSGGYTAGATSFILDDSSIVGITSILVNQRTNETYRVTANNTSTNTVTVSRSWGGTAAAALNDNDYVSILGTSPAEGDDSQVGQVTNESWKDNYVQEFRHPFGASWVAQASDVYFQALMPRRRAERMRDHKMNIELSLFYNEKATVTSGDERISTLGGMKEFITTNATSFGGIVTFDEMVDAAEDDFEFGSDTKFLFVGKAGYSGVAKVTTDTIRTANTVETFGLKLRQLELQHGTLMLHKHKLFRGNQYTKRGFVLDLNNIAYVPMQKLSNGRGGDTYLRQDLQSTSATANKEEWYTAATLRRELEDTHAIWNDLA
jgi:hypothetical protein